MVSKEMVDKLKLHYETNPHPYKINGLKKGMKSPLIKYVWSSFPLVRLIKMKYGVISL